MSWFNAHATQIGGVIAALILFAGSKFAVSRAHDHAFLLWFAFVVRAFIGLILGWSLFELTQWATSLPGTFGGIVSSVGAVVAVAGGWFAALMTVRLFRDLADGKPDSDARAAAMWVPILGPACFSAVFGIITNPRGIGTGITAAIIALISMVALHQVVKSCLKSTKHQLFWKWIAVVVSTLGGVIMIPLVMFADSQIAAHAPDNVVTLWRIAAGSTGLTLLIGAIADAWPKKEKQETTLVPDKWVRAFCAYGIPLVFLFGGLALGFSFDKAVQQGEVVTGSVSK